MGHKSEHEHEHEPDEIDRKARIAAMSDQDLISYHARLHSKALRGSEWIPLLEAEMKKRGLIKPS